MVSQAVTCWFLLVVSLCTPIVAGWSSPMLVTHVSSRTSSTGRSWMPTIQGRTGGTRLFSTSPDVDVLAVEDYYLGLAVGPEDVNAEVVYTIMYNAGTESEGVHTINYPRGSESDLLLAFEAIDDCIQLANAVKAGARAPGTAYTIPGDPIPTPTPWIQLKSACQQMGLPVGVVKMRSNA